MTLIGSPSPLASQDLIQPLSGLHPDLAILTAEDLAGRHPGEHPGNFGAQIMAQPSSTEAAAALVTWCAAHDVTVVPQGGLTGLVGGSISRPGEVILSTARLNRILSIEPEEMTATVEAGVTLEALQQAAAAHGLTTGIDLGSRGTATVGGIVSTNAGGILAFRNGVMRHQVLGLEAVLPSGAVLCDLTRVVKVSAGPDLKQLFIGGEGAFGFVTRVVLKLEPQRPHRATALVGVADARTALALVRHFRSQPTVTLEAAEMMWPRYIRDHAALKGLDLSWLEADAAALLIEVSGESVEAGLESRLKAIDPTYAAYVYGHIADGNLHLTLIKKGPLPDAELQAVEEAVYTGIHEAGGSFSAEHGVGLEKRHGYESFVSPEKQALGRALKQALDPKGLFNPGKVPF